VATQKASPATLFQESLTGKIETPNIPARSQSASIYSHVAKSIHWVYWLVPRSKSPLTPIRANLLRLLPSHVIPPNAGILSIQ
jgi:hypothetical protein